MKLALALLVVASGSLALPGIRKGDPTTYHTYGPLEVSVGAVNHITEHETGGKAYYTRFYERPQDPGYSSGVTVGFGYDLKFHSPSDIRKDWAGVATPMEIEAMVSVSGKDGSFYRSIRNKVSIDWNEGLTVFERVTLPRWCKKTYDAYRISELGPDFTMHPHVAGALVGNTFNRGTKITTGDRYIEKYRRRQAILSRQWDKIPQTYRDEQRHWSGHAGLTRRRREEAELTEMGLAYDWWQ